jgi:D-glycero-D-manno-heptose 1,7-bisphosphate phosphatase
MMRDIAQRYGVDLRFVPMVCDTLRDLMAAQAAGCEPHLVESGRATGLSEDLLAQMIEKVPGTTVHKDLGAFAEFLLRRDHIDLSTHGSLA